MIGKAAILLPLAASLVLMTAQASEPPVVEVFTDTTRFPLTGTEDVTVHDLSAPARLPRLLSQGLPRDPRAAEAIARARLQGAGPELREAYAGWAQAHAYGITRIPATVFDRGAAVVYGVTDVGEARALYRRWRENAP
jgi:integrating conjugative element protein (TIGR03757 family)